MVFTADESLAGLVNRPFAELPEVELAPTTDLRELEAVNAEYAPEKVSPEQEQEPATSDETPLETDAEQASNDSLEQTAATAASDASTDDDAEEPHEGELSASEGSEVADTPAQPLYESSETVESEDSTVTASEDVATEQTEEGNVLWKRAAIVFATAFIALLCFILLRYERSEILPPKETPAPQITTQKADTIPVSKERTQHITLKDRSEVFTHFEPDGVLDEHTIVFGDVLIRLAEHYYGNPYFVKYIIEYNNLPASGYTPVGTVLKIPRLRRKPGM